MAKMWQAHNVYQNIVLILQISGKSKHTKRAQQQYVIINMTF